MTAAKTGIDRRSARAPAVLRVQTAGHQNDSLLLGILLVSLAGALKVRRFQREPAPQASPIPWLALPVRARLSITVSEDQWVLSGTTGCTYDELPTLQYFVLPEVYPSATDCHRFVGGTRRRTHDR